MNATEEIPPVRARLRVEDIEIVESHDPLVRLTPGGRIHQAPAYHQRGIASAADEIRLRAGVYDRLRQVAQTLPDGVDLLVWDGLRSLETQQEIVEAFRATLPEEGREETVERYLAPPPASEADFLAMPPPHSTGGAVDLTLCDPSGRPLDLGADFDEFSEISWLRHYEENPEGEGRHYRDRRRILYWAMVGAGFSPYPWEFWHYELGTMVAQAHHGRPVAEYGAAVRWIGEPLGLT